jgi:hypothetical protein
MTRRVHAFSPRRLVFQMPQSENPRRWVVGCPGPGWNISSRLVDTCCVDRQARGWLQFGSNGRKGTEAKSRLFVARAWRSQVPYGSPGLHVRQRMAPALQRHTRELPAELHHATSPDKWVPELRFNMAIADRIATGIC